MQSLESFWSSFQSSVHPISQWEFQCFPSPFSTIKAVALDDEPLALDIISGMAYRIENISVKRTFTRQSEALKYIHNFDIDVLFLDIQMPKCNGFEFYKMINKRDKGYFYDGI